MKTASLTLLFFLISSLVFLVGDSASGTRQLILKDINTSSVYGGEAIPGCYFESNAACDASVKRCGETKCEMVDPSYPTVPSSVPYCPSTAIHDEQTAATYKIAAGSPSKTNKSKKALDPIDCLRNFKCLGAGGICATDPNTQAAYCDPSKGKTPIGFAGRRVPEVPDGAVCQQDVP
jgi:hypothetical protein